ncbi:MAG: carboxymuconolactone decarboxylase family protein [Burkholderiales bacterium]|nr:carboxymuconolactone decarboxylase family protein [Burkholderiales bacterium]
MSRLGQVDLDTAPALSRPMLEGVHRKRGFLPPMFRALGNSPAAMSAYVAFGGAMAGSTLPVSVKEQVSIAVAASSDCRQCMEAHTRYGREAGLPDDELEAARRFESTDPLAAAALAFARAVKESHGHLTDAAVDAARAGGIDDARMVDLAALVAINLFTNYVNNLAKPQG